MILNKQGGLAEEISHIKLFVNSQVLKKNPAHDDKIKDGTPSKSIMSFNTLLPDQKGMCDDSGKYNTYWQVFKTRIIPRSSKWLKKGIANGRSTVTNIV